ncbi:MAG: AAA family ATPase [Acidimicrobiales bacterium]
MSQVDGAGGEPIGRDLARRLGFSYWNEAVVDQVAEDHGVDLGTVINAEQRKSFFSRVVEAAAMSGVDAVALNSQIYTLDETDDLLSLIRDTVRDAAERGSVVLVAHAASYACADRSDVLRVCVTAPLSSRVSRLASARGISNKQAARFIHQSDAGRASYLKRVYGVDKESPADYDIVVNTEHLAPDRVTSLVSGLVSAGPVTAEAR